MKYRGLGSTSIKISEIGFGAWGIGGTPDDARAYGPTNDNESKLALETAFEKGVNFFDTSPLYGYGHSEKLIGEVFKHRRDKIIISTKVGFVNFKGGQDFSPKNIEKSLDESLKRTNSDYMDVYQLHDPPLSAIEQNDEILKTFESLKSKGKIRAIGISTKSPNESLLAMEKFNFDCVQINFSLVDQRAVEIGLLDLARKKRVGIIGRTPLCFGFLTGQYKSKSEFSDGDHRSLWSEKQIENWANAYQLFSKDLSQKQTNAQIALRFCLSYPEVTTTIPGMLNVDHVVDNTTSSQLGPFPNDIINKFKKIYEENTFFVR